MTFEDATVICWTINNENLNSEYLKLLEDITPVKPLLLKREAFSILSEAASKIFVLCIEKVKAEAVRVGLESLVPRTEEAIRKKKHRGLLDLFSHYRTFRNLFYHHCFRHVRLTP